jgi:hypothetical protein
MIKLKNNKKNHEVPDFFFYILYKCCMCVLDVLQMCA